jgi:hypothetical protein
MTLVLVRPKQIEELILRWGLHRQVGRLLALEDAANVNAGLAIRIGFRRLQESACSDCFAKRSLAGGFDAEILCDLGNPRALLLGGSGEFHRPAEIDHLTGHDQA